MARTRITMFSWGYYGWGSATEQLLQAVDVVEESRGFEPPIFVDIRLKRQVRAAGFRDNAFEKLLGPSRHRWMKSLGNLAIATRTGPPIQIADPKAAEELLDLAVEANKDGRRVIFFCGCAVPREGGKPFCHRDRVTTLLLAAARKRKQPLQVVEWPGEPLHVSDLEVSDKVIGDLEAGKSTIPLGNNPDLARFASLPHGAIVRVRSRSDKLLVITAPAVYKKGQWSLTPFGVFDDDQLASAKKKANSWRRSLGYEPRK